MKISVGGGKEGSGRGEAAAWGRATCCCWACQPGFNFVWLIACLFGDCLVVWGGTACIELVDQVSTLLDCNLYPIEWLLINNDPFQMLPTLDLLDQIREVKLVEEEEALEMGREAATIRHLFPFVLNTFIGSLSHLATFYILCGQGSLCEDPWGGAEVQPEDQQWLQDHRGGADQDECPASIIIWGGASSLICIRFVYFLMYDVLYDIFSTIYVWTVSSKDIFIYKSLT